MTDRRYVRLLLETSEGPVLLADGEMDWSEVTGPPDALIIPGLPNVLRNVAESIESAQTTGPPEEWLEPSSVVDGTLGPLCGNLFAGPRASACVLMLDHLGGCSDHPGDISRVRASVEPEWLRTVAPAACPAPRPLRGDV